LSVDLRGARSREEFVAMIAGQAGTVRPGRWLTGGNWDNGAWSDRRLPSKEDLDPYTQAWPVFVTRSDLHMGLANSCALAAAGITAATPDPAGGAIMRDSRTGKPTGILKDAALELVPQGNTPA
jgi:predicted amidohydrolase YtcJ